MPNGIKEKIIELTGMRVKSRIATCPDLSSVISQI
nr:MAG TPA: hypothetical protein [Caudoviricetes sp.]